MFMTSLQRTQSNLIATEGDITSLGVAFLPNIAGKQDSNSKMPSTSTLPKPS